MSKLNTNKDILNFLKKNKVKIIAGSMLIVALVASPAEKKYINDLENSNISTIDSNGDSNLSTKDYILKNIDNIEVINDKEDMFYELIQSVSKKIPMYENTAFGNKKVIGYKVEKSGVKVSYISKSLANELNLSELLETKANSKALIKF